MTASERLWRFLRSRKLAVWLLLAVMGWAVVGTMVPQSSFSADHSAWDAAHPLLGKVAAALGLHEAYSAPFFLILLAVLAFSTAACSIDRTRFAMRFFADRRGIPTAALERLGRQEPLCRTDLDPVRAREIVSETLRSLGLRVRATPSTIEGSAGLLGPVGSPLFHWALTGLFVCVAAGQLTGASGLVGVPVGGELLNTPSAYGVYKAGPLHSSWASSLAIAVPSVETSRVVGKVVVPIAPKVVLTRGTESVASGAVYANSPLRYGPILVHLSGEGWSGQLTYTREDGSREPMTVYFDSVDGKLGSARVSLSSATGDPIPVVLTPAKSTDGSRTRRARVLVGIGPSAVDTTVVEGTPVVVGGSSLVLGSLGPYVRLSVVEDWTVYLVYGLFVLATLGVGLAVLSPRRVVRVATNPIEGGLAVRVQTSHQRKDPSFQGIVEGALLDALGSAVVADGPGGRA